MTTVISTNTVSDNNVGGKRKIQDSSADPSPKFSKIDANNKVVPNVVAVDFGPPAQNTSAPPPHSTSAVVAVQPTSASTQGGFAISAAAVGNERPIETKLDWKLINNRDALNRVLKLGKMNTKGAAYISVDVGAYKEISGITVQLGEYNHFKTRGPFMLNIFGLSHKVVSGNISHSIVYDIKNSSMAADLPEWANFLALMDDVVLDKCVELAVRSPMVRQSTDWVEDCKDDETNEINLTKLRKKIAKYYHGAMRCSNKALTSEEHKTITFDEETDVPDIGDEYYFKTKVKGKYGNQHMLDLSCYKMDDKAVFYGLVEELEEPRATFIQADFEVPAVNFVQKEFYMTWATRKIKFKTTQSMRSEEAEQMQTDFNGNLISKSEADEIARQEKEYAKKLLQDQLIPSIVVAGDDGGFDG